MDFSCVRVRTLPPQPVRSQEIDFQRTTVPRDWDRVKRSLNSAVLVDLRNICRPAEMEARGFRYVSVGQCA